MTKSEIKKLIEGDDHLQWWAGILFAEISELADSSCDDPKILWSIATTKIKEFEWQVRQRMIDVAEGKVKQLQSLEDRVAKLEKRIIEMTND